MGEVSSKLVCFLCTFVVQLCMYSFIAVHHMSMARSVSALK